MGGPLDQLVVLAGVTEYRYLELINKIGSHLAGELTAWGGGESPESRPNVDDSAMWGSRRGAASGIL